ncbi:MAG: FAD-binding oxidoreductase [Actinobacteria bacterium]|nr:FAD-binding oxidoreductase [Actinomycetota bacterium]MBU1944219.1 FAD-binding oxidoreductase [Actinomycetota bacterium]MBU2688388.1 FAD-binding oxidoreductase [Actinomycetota bacterium]
MTVQTASRESAYLELEHIVGPEHITSSPVIMDSYTFQFNADNITGTNWGPFRPWAVILPESTRQVQAIVRVCNEHEVPFKAISTGWAIMGAPSCEGCLQIDLRRMNHIIEIDEENMYAVVEPYVSGAALQAEAMKKGLNCHIHGAGSNASLLANATSVCGQGNTGMSTSHSNRNLLGVEWVTPTGEVLHLGSLGQTGRWFTGDGPGPSLRGAMRGFLGAFGGIGVFTRCALKLYPWYGPREPEVKGTTPDYWLEGLDRIHVFQVVLESWDSFADFCYKLGEAEIAMVACRNAPVVAVAGVVDSNEEFVEIWESEYFQSFPYALSVVIDAGSDAEFAHRTRVLHDIVDDCGGLIQFATKTRPSYIKYQLRMLNWLRKQHGTVGAVRVLYRAARSFGKIVHEKGMDHLARTMAAAMIKAHANARAIFRFGGSFITTFGALETIDAAVAGAKRGIEVKKPYIERGVLMDDTGDNAWGTIYEQGALMHLEEVAAYDPSDPEAAAGATRFMIDAIVASRDDHIGFCFNGFSDLGHGLLSDQTSGYYRWLAALKDAFDPAGVSDGGYYVSRSEEVTALVDGLQKH